MAPAVLIMGILLPLLMAAAFLLGRHLHRRQYVRDELSPVTEVDQIAVYSQVDAVQPDSKVLDHLRRGEIDCITLTSANIARALVGSLDEPARARLASGEVKLISISPVTSAAVKELGLPVAAEATAASTEGLFDAILRLAAGHSPCGHRPVVGG